MNDDTIRLKDLKDYFCKIRCPFYTDDFSCQSGQFCFIQDIKTKIFDSYNGANISYQLVDYKFNPVNPEVDKFDREDIIGIVLDRRVPGTNYWICMALTELIENIWCTDSDLEIKTTLDNCVENLEIIKNIDPEFDKFPVFKKLQDSSKFFGRQLYLGSSVDYQSIQINSETIQDILEKYDINNNIEFSDCFWTSSVSSDKYDRSVCGLVLDDCSVCCGYGRDDSCSVLPLFIINNNYHEN